MARYSTPRSEWWTRPSSGVSPRAQMAISSASRARLAGRFGDGGATLGATHHAGDAELAHQARHPVAAGLDALAGKLPPNLAGAVDLEVVVPDPLDLDLEPLVGDRAG